ncbi:hypothetical protein PAXRUDRAFT_822587 [Paxillus rubicundulus Ve08.2h10]|uniref:Unplaced genomic scaffold scaffold_33, whole genome shotgun sequence n=1 Tax=Paxillus rubicundulus Ve08.2h10 TaxID=930991 RepID=A0A0D0DLR6_9AGAM|nr:hypothetical protein PAXRUDRAFT_822587 [Paxillus rubicundulus Ve08.2h10]
MPENTSSNSSLANALGPEPGYSIYLTGPPLTNPSYPYPARNVLNPTTYPARTPRNFHCAISAYHSKSISNPPNPMGTNPGRSSPQSTSSVRATKARIPSAIY